MHSNPQMYILFERVLSGSSQYFLAYNKGFEGAILSPLDVHLKKHRVVSSRYIYAISFKYEKEISLWINKLKVIAVKHIDWLRQVRDTFVTKTIKF